LAQKEPLGKGNTGWCILASVYAQLKNKLSRRMRSLCLRIKG